MAEPAAAPGAAAAQVLAAGGVPWRSGRQGVEVALVHRPRYDDWSLPKGKLGPGEQPLLAALREVAEETGLDCVPGRQLGLVRHPLPGGGHKVSRYWAMRPVAGDFTANAEVDDLRWLPLGQAHRLLSHPQDRRPLDALAALPVDLPPVLLVRHASAGSRERWAGADLERPLDHVGRHQAVLLADHAAAFRPESIYSAEALRCQQTVEPLAARLGLSVRCEPALGEQANLADVTAALAVLHAVAAAGRPAVLCSQGGVIPALLAALSADVPTRQLPTRARKGSLWTLFFHHGRLCDWTYTARLDPPIPDGLPAR